MFFFLFYIIPYEYNVSIILFFGFAVVIIGFFFFINLNHDKDENDSFSFKFLSEGTIKIILMVLICISLFIKPILSPTTVILWNQVSPLNYIRAFISIIGCTFIPGAGIYNIFFPNSELHKRFDIEPFLLKISLYPLLSFLFIGLSVLFLDQIGLIRSLFEFVLFLLIMGLFLSDFIIQEIRKNKIRIDLINITISRYSIIILLISFGVLLISLGVHIGMNYLIPGDSWIGLAAANYIGYANLSPIEWGQTNGYYPIFWSYIIFGLSILSGLPYVNTNALLAPFCYLFITCVYLLMRAILLEFKKFYATFSTILISIFSGLFYISSDLGHGNVPGLIYVGVFYFIYKTYAFLLFFIAIALFILLSKTENIENEIKFSYIKNKNIKFFILISLFLVSSFMLYVLPLIIGLIIIFLYCFFSDDRVKNFRLFSILIFFLMIIFISLDIMMQFYLSTEMFYILIWFLQIKLLSLLFTIIPSYILIYSIFAVIFFLTIWIRLICSKHFLEKENTTFFFDISAKTAFKCYLFIFIIFLIIEIISIILEEFVIDYELNDKLIFFYYLDFIYLKIGFIGILAVFLSYYCITTDKKLFSLLTSWILTIILLGSVLIFSLTVINFSFLLSSIDDGSVHLMGLWYKRIWIYSVIPFCILASIGLKKLAEEVKIHPKFKNIFAKKNRANILKYTSFSLLIYLTYSNLIIAGIWNGNINNRPKEEEIEIIGWMSENIPPDSNILTDYNYIIRLGIFSMVNARYYFINDIFEKDVNITENIEEIEYLIDNDIEYLLVSEDYLEESDSSDRVHFVKNYLIPNFYNETEHETDDYEVYSASYFD